MENLILDKTDLNILATLARDCRISYNSIGSQSGLTSKSVKLRVKNMISSGIIEKFIVIVNPTGFGYRAANILVLRNNEISKEDVIERIKQFGDLVFHVHHMGRTSAATVIFKEPWDDQIVQSLDDSLNPAIVKRINFFELPVSTDLSETDLRIMKCLLKSGARIEISEIAKELGISEKTTTRRLDRMKEGRLLDFSVQCDPASMIGYIQFVILITVERSYYRSVYERMYSEFQENILKSSLLLQPPLTTIYPTTINPNDLLIFVLFGENVFMIDSVLAKVDTFEGVKNADVYINTELKYHDDWIMKEIDERLLPQRPPSNRSIKEAATSIV